GGLRSLFGNLELTPTLALSNISEHHHHANECAALADRCAHILDGDLRPIVVPEAVVSRVLNHPRPQRRDDWMTLLGGRHITRLHRRQNRTPGPIDQRWAIPPEQRRGGRIYKSDMAPQIQTE